VHPVETETAGLGGGRNREQGAGSDKRGERFTERHSGNPPGMLLMQRLLHQYFQYAGFPGERRFKNQLPDGFISTHA
jgi:hypothetical protein